jgi:ELWxxDGT repeat protein
VFNGEVLFNGSNTAGNAGLWVTDGTAAGTHEITGISGAFDGGGNPAAAGVDPRDLTVFNGEVLFEGINSAYQTGLWVTDGTAAGTHEITVSGASTAGIFGGANDSGAALLPDLTPFSGKVLFVARGADQRVGLWTTDGTTAGTHEITTFAGAIGGLTVFNKEVLFTGPDRGVWVTDGTASGPMN